MNEHLSRFNKKDRYINKSHENNTTDKDMAVLDRFASKEIKYELNHQERQENFNDTMVHNVFLEKIKKDEQLFTRYIHYFSNYRGEVVFLDDNLLKLEGEPLVELPQNYALKGGAARVTLEKALGINTNALARDIDICYIGSAEEEDIELSKSLAESYADEDLQNGHGVETLEENYFQSRDFTINEVLVVNNVILLSKQALLDTLRSIIRFSEFEKTNFYYQENYNEEKEVSVRFVNNKLASKALRLISEKEGFDFIDSDFFDHKSINDFHMALHLDRAMEIGPEVADRFVQKLKDYRQIPADINGPIECISYLNEYTDFVFRHNEKYSRQSVHQNNTPFSVAEFEKEYKNNFASDYQIEEKYHDIVDFFDKNKA
jgi:hypothetical protein